MKKIFGVFVGAVLVVLAASAAPGAAAALESPALSQLRQMNGAQAPAPAPQVAPAPVAHDDAQPASRKVTGIGIAHSGNPFDIPNFSPPEIARMIKDAGGTHYRPHLPLNEALPQISAQDMDRLRRAGSDPALLETMIDELSRHGRWDRMDGLVQAFTGSGIKLILVTGCGYKKEAPFYLTSDGALRQVSPDGIGRDVYLTLMKWLVGAGVRRYAGVVDTWQAENEINVAGETALLNGWRIKEKSWSDAGFLQQLVAVIADTIHQEGRRQGRQLRTTHNFAPAPWDGLVEHSGVAKLIETYGPSLDIIGIDLYENYFLARPFLNKPALADVADAVRAAGGKPVWVLETGYARGPSQRGFSDANQAAYFQQMFDGAYTDGADLVLAFGWFWNPLGWYTDQKDQPLPWWSPMATEQYWSPLTVSYGPDGAKTVSYGPAWDVFKQAARKWVGGRP